MVDGFRFCFRMLVLFCNITGLDSSSRHHCNRHASIPRKFVFHLYYYGHGYKYFKFRQPSDPLRLFDQTPFHLCFFSKALKTQIRSNFAVVFGWFQVLLPHAGILQYHWTRHAEVHTTVVGIQRYCVNSWFICIIDTGTNAADCAVVFGFKKQKTMDIGNYFATSMFCAPRVHIVSHNWFCCKRISYKH
jgi:hypothetical protein